MITFLLYKLLRQYLKKNNISARQFRQYLKNVAKVLLPAILCLLLLKTAAQQATYEYEVIRNNKVIGRTVVTGTKSTGKVTYNIIAEIKVNLIKDFIAVSEEETVFEKGVMVYSSFSRSLNGVSKARKKIRRMDSVYESDDDGKKQLLKLGKVNHTIGSLYLNEPINTNQIFSDNYQRWLKISQVKPHSYRLTLPDGNYTIYHYESGVCVNIDIYQTFYSVRLSLISQPRPRVNIPISSSF